MLLSLHFVVLLRSPFMFSCKVSKSTRPTAHSYSAPLNKTSTAMKIILQIMVSPLHVHFMGHFGYYSCAIASSGVSPDCGGDVTLEAMMRAGSLGIQLLPRSALKGVVLLTDGTSGFSSPSSLHNTVGSMRGGNISCWVVHVGGTSHPCDALGLVPGMETLNFITKACNGCVLQPLKVKVHYFKRFNN